MAESEAVDHMPSLPAATEQERELSHLATQEFNKQNYEGCISTMNKLHSSRGQDPKVIMNRSVAEFYKSGFSTTEDLRQALALSCKKTNVNLDNVTIIEDMDHCVTFYNHAVVMYYLRQYRTALALLDRLFQFMEPSSDPLSRKIMFLLVELYLRTYQPDKAMGMVAFIEKNVMNSGKSNSPEKDGEKKESSGKESKESINEATMESYRTRIGQFKARCYMMLKSTKSCKREVKALVNSIGMSVPVIYLKSNFEYLRGNCRKAIKVLNSATALKPTSETGEHLQLMYYNNLGIIHFHMNKHNLGAYYFRKAIAENKNAYQEWNKSEHGDSLSGRPIQTVGVGRQYELMYNLGVQMLHCGEATVAFDLLIQTVQTYPVNPRLWLRLAECCIQANKTNNEEDEKLSERLKVVLGSEGSGIHRKLILGPGLATDKNSSDTAALPVPSLEFASLCLQNALTLIPREPASPNSSNPDEPATEFVLAPPGNPIRGQEAANLRCSILASSAYVSLCLNDHRMSLQFANQLLRQPRLSGAHRYLGHMYKAEALVAVDHIADAVQHLNPEFVTDVGVMFPESKQDSERERNGEKDAQDLTEARGPLFQWTPKDVPKAKGLMLYNLSTAHAIRGEYEKALNTLNKTIQTLELIGSSLPSQMLSLKLYLELMEGRKDLALRTVKQYYGHITPNKV